jgi:hypothetical protein
VEVRFAPGLPVLLEIEVLRWPSAAYMLWETMDYAIFEGRDLVAIMTFWTEKLQVLTQQR